MRAASRMTWWRVEFYAWLRTMYHLSTLTRSRSTVVSSGVMEATNLVESGASGSQVVSLSSGRPAEPPERLPQMH